MVTLPLQYEAVFVQIVRIGSSDFIQRGPVLSAFSFGDEVFSKVNIHITHSNNFSF